MKTLNLTEINRLIELYADDHGATIEELLLAHGQQFEKGKLTVFGNRAGARMTAMVENLALRAMYPLSPECLVDACRKVVCKP